MLSMIGCVAVGIFFSSILEVVAFYILVKKFRTQILGFVNESCEGSHEDTSEED